MKRAVLLIFLGSSFLFLMSEVATCSDNSWASYWLGVSSVCLVAWFFYCLKERANQ